MFHDAWKLYEIQILVIINKNFFNTYHSFKYVPWLVSCVIGKAK